MGTCRLTSELIDCRLWRFGAVAVAIYKLLFARARYRQGLTLASSSLWGSGTCAATLSHGLSCMCGRRMAICCFVFPHATACWRLYISLPQESTPYCRHRKSSKAPRTNSQQAFLAYKPQVLPDYIAYRLARHPTWHESYNATWILGLRLGCTTSHTKRRVQRPSEETSGCGHGFDWKDGGEA